VTLWLVMSLLRTNDSERNQPSRSETFAHMTRSGETPVNSYCE
jgi:hypothetical protein